LIKVDNCGEINLSTVFVPRLGVTVYTDQPDIWHGRVYMDPLLHAKFGTDGYRMGTTVPNFNIWSK